MEEKLRKDELARTVKFTPPLYKQRYQFIKQLVIKHKPKKVADLGCADCRLLWMLKFCNCIEILVGLDISEDVMKEKMHTLCPLPGDFLQPSERPLTIILHQGSVAEKDPCMLGFDMVTCVELIEHLEAEELEKFPEVVFGFMSPAMIVISTPNSEFNRLLPTATLFRHPDHKFEWNRAQFQNWALDVAAHYGYTVEFTGLGTPPSEEGDVGFCTQIGVFVRKYLKNGEPETVEKYKEHVYKTTAVVNEVLWTSQTIARRLLGNRKSKYKKRCDGVETDPPFLTSCFLRLTEYPSLTEAENSQIEPFINGQTVHVPLAKIFSVPKVKQLCGTFETLRKLITGKVALSNDGSALLVDTEYENEEQGN
ncbi:small RNA 2'-O-methyltransferase isoform X2 [Sphaerodactylus townsendi]|uniref:small RNA 2'-O-methyltransferase isoform X2 n=1 Tax=Sphaerodactylus townsendi TaxID=933632 RepID=UPI002026899A|nr:small RNA 2'-O-methyltransferase isoform X2 [Sphaerodactylus townsendi]